MAAMAAAWQRENRKSGNGGNHGEMAKINVSSISK
jgi:hypothetical protein